MDEKRLIEVDDLRVHFPLEDETVKAVDGVSWHIDKGETLAVVGESGSGKSVTAMSLMRLTDYAGGKIMSGTVNFRRKNENVIDLASSPQDVMRDIRGNDISMIFQEPMTSLNPVFTVGMQIAEAIVLHQGKTEQEALEMSLEMLKLVRIPEPEKQLTQYPHQLSGGMRQRVMIAMALSCRPSLLIADEPTTALDVTIQAQILDLIKMLQRDIGMSVMFITHDMGVVAEVADRVVVMLRGEKVEEGPALEVFHNPQHPYTKALLSAVPKLGSMTGRVMPAKFANVDVSRAEGDEVKESQGGPELLDVKDTVRRDAPPILEVKGLTTRFDIRKGIFGSATGRIHAVEGVDFSLQPGETLALVGESGCGKSTTGRSIIRLTQPTRGSVIFEGQELTGLSGKDMRPYRRQMQMIFQDPFASLNPRMNLLDLVGEPLLVNGVANRKERSDRVADLLHLVGLRPEYMRRFPHAFSGGQRQRIVIARALALNPRLVVADEPVSALDVSVQAQVLNLLLDLQEQLKLTYLFVAHDLSVVRHISDRVAVMYVGRIVEMSPTDELFLAPKHPYTAALLSAVPVADPRIRSKMQPLEGDVPSPSNPPNGCHFHPRCPFATDLCRQKAPDLEEVQPNHFVACHRQAELALSGVSQPT